MSRRVTWTLALLVVAALAAAGARWWWLRSAAPATTSAPNTPPTSKGADASAQASAQTPAQAIELAPSDVANARMAELTRVLAVNGSLKAASTALVKAKVAAELKTLTVREGERVKAGQRIGQLDDTEFVWRLRQAEDQVAAAQTQLDVAQRTLDNNKALVNQGFISRNALDTSVSNAAGAQASLQAARAAAEIARKAVRDADIVAPISGLIAQRLAQPGERVGVDGRIVEIIDLARVELEAAVAPEDVVALRVGQAARVSIDGLAEPVNAKVTRINPSAQSGSRSVLAYLELQPTPGLRQGLFARAEIELQRKSALVVPASSLRFDQAQPYVLALEDGKAVRRRITTGLRGDAVFDGQAENAVEVTQGLATGATVLRGSVGALREGTRLLLSGGARPPAAPSPAPASTAASSPL